MIHSIRLKDRFDIFKEDLSALNDTDVIHVTDRKGNWLLTSVKEIQLWKKFDDHTRDYITLGYNNTNQLDN